MPLKSEGVKVLDTWKVLGMRGTGSHDILLDGVFVPDAAAKGVRRPAGKWHPFMHTVALVALPASAAPRVAQGQPPPREVGWVGLFHAALIEWLENENRLGDLCPPPADTPTYV